MRFGPRQPKLVVSAKQPVGPLSQRRCDFHARHCSRRRLLWRGVLAEERSAARGSLPQCPSARRTRLAQQSKPRPSMPLLLMFYFSCRFWVKRQNGSCNSFPILSALGRKEASPVRTNADFRRYLLAHRAKKTKSDGCESIRANLLTKRPDSMGVSPNSHAEGRIAYNFPTSVVWPFFWPFPLQIFRNLCCSL